MYNYEHVICFLTKVDKCTQCMVSFACDTAQTNNLWNYFLRNSHCGVHLQAHAEVNALQQQTSTAGEHMES